MDEMNIVVKGSCCPNVLHTSLHPIQDTVKGRRGEERRGEERRGEERRGGERRGEERRGEEKNSDICRAPLSDMKINCVSHVY